ncbi:MAG: C69 family dipeptidase [Prevotella sp.]|uniref:dipeptidase n=1 Tax=unclassified Dysgonomonas TaxID=2630389 RepID=UPI0025BBE861|nr:MULTISPECIES: C69 family dipeptidase [unclassified Dysgonomonas]MDR1501892.1 C69 family dipeptidase [Prevotella sp.]MDR1714410.1 C69 family dipeptidase [Prevotella sp.]MDR2002964.1 C69 family dipeptidase [Prevotella sp.]HMM03918.1 C69 family dipeptidase [Dysgonomonas sp.]
MKKIFLFTLFYLAAQIHVFACTNFLVGKKASLDGSTIISYSADSYALFGELYHWPAKKWAKGDMLKVYEWDTGRYMGEIAQPAQTYNVVGNMNEHQVTIGETTFGGREELADPDGIMDYGSLIYITLQRAKNAREAIKVMTELVAEYGYYSGGESFSIGDPNEIWVLEMIGKGKGNKGAVWVAVRIPDDCISAHANQARIQQFPLNDPENCIYSKDVISFAKEKGYYTGKDTDFSFAKAYNPLDFGGQRFCEARVWTFFNRYNKDMAKFVTYAQGKTQEPMPLYIKPDRKLSVADVQEMMRDHYEGTELDWTNDVGAGPFKSPYRWAPLTWESDSVQYCNERPVATQQTGFVFTSQMRSWLPDPIGGILWFGTDDADQTVFTPMYCSITEVPECYREGNGDLYTFSWTSSFWIQNWVSNMVYNKYSYMHPDLEKVQKELESKFFAEQDKTDKEALALYEKSQEQAVRFLTEYSGEQAQYAFDKWKKLGEFLVIKYMDGVVRKEKDGEFIRNEHGKPSSPQRVGYPKEFYRQVVKETGDKYKVLY